MSLVVTGPHKFKTKMNRFRSTLRSGVYQHYKGELYKVLCTARDEKTLERMVVYRKFGRRGESVTWVRSQRVFEESVMHDGKCVKRFEYLRV